MFVMIEILLVLGSWTSDFLPVILNQIMFLYLIICTVEPLLLLKGNPFCIRKVSFPEGVASQKGFHCSALIFNVNF